MQTTRISTETIDAPKNFLIDMDGVLVRGSTAIPGAKEFIQRLEDAGAKYLVLTNSPRYTPGDLSHRLKRMGIVVSAEHIFTSAMATARFLAEQRGTGGTAYVLGGSGLTEALHKVGFVITDQEPEYVIVGEPETYAYAQITRAVRLIAAGAHFVATNPDVVDKTDDGLEPACGALAALVEQATGVAPFFVGKPNPLMMRSALNHLGVHSEDTLMIGDRMDTDIIGGVEAGMRTTLVLTGVTTREMAARFAFQPSQICESIADISL